MKPLLLLLLAGCAFGQDCATCALTVEPPEMPQSTCGLVVNGKPSDCRLPVKKKPAGQKPAKKHCALTIKGKCSGYVTQDEPCIVTNGTEKGVTSKPCPPTGPDTPTDTEQPPFHLYNWKIHPPAKKDYLCMGACMTQTDKPEVEVEVKPSEPIDVPAIQETVASFPVFISNCNEGSNICMGGSGSCSHHGHFAQLRFESKCEGGWEWKCEDDNRGLIVSQNDKFATCHKVQP